MYIILCDRIDPSKILNVIIENHQKADKNFFGFFNSDEIILLRNFLIDYQAKIKMYARIDPIYDVSTAIYFDIKF